ncbi:MAG: hypothetical protein LIQ31_01995 [Planctomycetes bacterium]|nr:hypothetical protein [Planctomycetota bacterium]
MAIVQFSISSWHGEARTGRGGFVDITDSVAVLTDHRGMRIWPLSEKKHVQTEKRRGFSFSAVTIMNTMSTSDSPTPIRVGFCGIYGACFHWPGHGPNAVTVADFLEHFYVAARLTGSRSVGRTLADRGTE